MSSRRQISNSCDRPQCLGRNVVPLIPAAAFAGPPTPDGARPGRISEAPSIFPRLKAVMVGLEFGRRDSHSAKTPIGSGEAAGPACRGRRRLRRGTETDTLAIGSLDDLVPRNRQPDRIAGDKVGCSRRGRPARRFSGGPIFNILFRSRAWSSLPPGRRDCTVMRVSISFKSRARDSIELTPFAPAPAARPLPFGTLTPSPCGPAALPFSPCLPPCSFAPALSCALIPAPISAGA